MTDTLKVTTPSDREVALTRVFDAPRRLVFDAMTQPELVKRWLSGPPGWSLAVCEIDLRVGGAYRYVWRGPDGYEMGMGGIFREITRPERFVGTEKFDQSWYPGEAVGTFVFTEQGSKTLFTVTLRYDSKEARDAVLATPMTEGAGSNYDRLAEFLTSLSQAGAQDAA